VQVFPEAAQAQKKAKNLKIIYGCEMEMLENDFVPYLFNCDLQTKEKLKKNKIADLTYCIFDLETTGFFSNYNEIIEIGYVIYRKGEIIRQSSYLICPVKEIASEILAT
jgi:DNA polymerase-3 subunit alpha (Gram-positive type)